jgi:hypothetical protein
MKYTEEEMKDFAKYAKNYKSSNSVENALNDWKKYRDKCMDRKIDDRVSDYEIMELKTVVNSTTGLTPKMVVRISDGCIFSIDDKFTVLSDKSKSIHTIVRFQDLDKKMKVHSETDDFYLREIQKVKCEKYELLKDYFATSKIGNMTCNTILKRGTILSEVKCWGVFSYTEHGREVYIIESTVVNNPHYFKPIYE